MCIRDRPNTVAGAARAALSTQAFMFNVHASGGREMMRKVREKIDKAHIAEKPIILAVTVLTSLDETDLKDINISKSPLEQVKSLALMTKESGLDGVVASPKEISAIREAVGQDFIIEMCIRDSPKGSWSDGGSRKQG